MKKIRETLGGAVVLKKVRALQGDLDPQARQALVSEIEKVREVLSAIAREVKERREALVDRAGHAAGFVHSMITK